MNGAEASAALKDITMCVTLQSKSLPNYWT